MHDLLVSEHTELRVLAIDEGQKQLSFTFCPIQISNGELSACDPELLHLMTPDFTAWFKCIEKVHLNQAVKSGVIKWKKTYTDIYVSSILNLGHHFVTYNYVQWFRDMFNTFIISMLTLFF